MSRTSRATREGEVLNWAMRAFRTGSELTSMERTGAALVTSGKSTTSRFGLPRKKS